MNKKIFDHLVTLASAIGVICTILQLPVVKQLHDFLQTKGIFQTLLQVPVFQRLFSHIDILNFFTFLCFLALSILFIYFLRKKKRFLDLYDTLYLMSINNKLHPIREMVMIASNRLHGVRNHVKVISAKFFYSIRPSQTSTGSSSQPPKTTLSSYDVDYKIQFLLKKPLFLPHRQKFRFFSFYAICEQEDLTVVDSFLRSINAIVKIPDSKKTSLVSFKTVPAVYPTTTSGSGQDRNPRFSGLYQISLVIPPSFSSEKELELEVSYTLRNNIHSNEHQYCFVILPSNYGTKIGKMEIIVDSEGLNIYQVILQQMSYNQGFCTPASFMLTKSASKKITYSITNGNSIVPDINSVYVIQLDYFDTNLP